MVTLIEARTTSAASLSGHLPMVVSHSPVAMAWRRFAHQPAGIIGTSIVVGVVLLAICAPLLAPYSPLQQFAGSELSSPSGRFPFGTDNLGRDVFTRVMFGTRVSLLVGVIAVAIAASLGGIGGLVAGYAGGFAAAVLMRLADAVFAVPGILLGITFAAAFGASATTAAVAIGVATMPTFARLTRAAVLGERSREYVLAARVVGATPVRIVLRHILPNALGPLLVQVAMTMAAAVLLEAGLSFLGLGSQPPQPSLGIMLADSRQYLRQAPWFGVFPGVALTLLVWGLNSLADALRDALDPRSS
jgi:peptide/nickel transport system permease protein